MERRLADWRRMMNDLQIELPSMKTSIHNFVTYLEGTQGLETLEAVKLIVLELDADLSSLKTRIDETYAALRVDMQFFESRRSISEAKTVTKLTELAFIFIPLSFVSSLFSMSVDELRNGVPIWTFVLAALIFALLAYGIRFIVANDFLTDSSRRALERFWARRNVRRGASIPTLTFVQLTAQEIWDNGGQELFAKCLGLSFLSAFVVVPVGFMWASIGLDTGFKISLTLLLVLSALGIGIFMAKSEGHTLRTGFFSSRNHRQSSHDDSESSGEDV